MDKITMLRGLLREALPYFDAKTRPDDLFDRMSEEAFKKPRKSKRRSKEPAERTDTADVTVGYRTRVYVAGPYSKGDIAVNVKEAVRMSDELLKLGYAPYCPHLTHFWHMMFPHEYDAWLDLDNEWVTCCDALLRIPGESSGADKEVALAEFLGLPVFFSIEELAEAVPVARPEGGIPDREILQLEALHRSSRERPAELPRGIPEGVTVTPSQPASGTLLYNSELPKGIPTEVTVEATPGKKPEVGTPPRPLVYKKPK